MNVIQFTPRTTSDHPGLFEPLRSLAGLRPGDSIEQTGLHAACLMIDLTPEPVSVDLKRDGKTLLVVTEAEGPGGILRRFDLADGVSITATRRKAGGFEIDFVRATDKRPAHDRANRTPSR